MSWLPNWVTGYDEANAAAAAAAETELRRINDDKIARGYYDAAQAEQISRNYGSQAYLDEAGAQAAIGEAFDEGWEAGRRNVSGVIKGTLNRIIADPLRALIGGIPWWLWLAAIVAVFGYFGGFQWLKKRMK